MAGDQEILIFPKHPSLDGIKSLDLGGQHINCSVEKVCTELQ